MNQLGIRRIIILFLLLVVLQVPMLHNWVFYGVAFPLPYVGFLLLLPHGVNRVQSMLLSAFIGLVMDLFSSTPGMHMSVSILVAFTRPWLVDTITDATDVDRELSLSYLGFVRFVTYILPMVLLHHFVLFALENEGFERAGLLLTKVGWSALVSFGFILVAEFMTTNRLGRE